VIFSPDSRQLAVLSQDRGLQVFDVTDPVRPVLRRSQPFSGGSAVAFFDDTRRSC
jgi:hypothetical protein